MRAALSVIGILAFAQPTLANDDVQIDGLTPKAELQEALPVCQNIPFTAENCVRAMACLGSEGVYFDGQAHGWDTGVIIGYLNDGTSCEGQWVAGGADTPGRVSLTCANDVEVNVLYHTLDNETGTAIGSGVDSLGREVTGWSGEKVLQFLTGPDDDTPVLPCGPEPIPIS